jgi:Spy/CpxP family protein refolding chaperone
MHISLLPIKSISLSLTFATLSLFATSSALAGSFPCADNTPCETAQSATPAPAPQAKPAAEATANNSINWDAVNANYPFLKNLGLTAEQRNILSNMLTQQMPSIYDNISALENARALLREMALAKKYDESLAKIAAERIANSSAALAVLQAEREYQIFALLTDEQSKQFAKMKANGEIKQM